MRSDIEGAIAANEVWSKIGRHFFIDWAAVKAHSDTCLGSTLRGAKGDARARCLLLVERVESLIVAAETDEFASYKDRASLISAARGTLELLGRFTGELGPDREIVVVESARWKRIEAALAEALAPHPAAAAAVAKALQALEAA
jgi:hypothetical protein